MYTFAKSLSIQQLLLEQLPALSFSVVIAELFYKFHSFTLELLAFLGTWYLIDAAIQSCKKAMTSSSRRRL